MPVFCFTASPEIASDQAPFKIYLPAIEDAAASDFFVRFASGFEMKIGDQVYLEPGDLDKIFHVESSQEHRP